MEGFPMPHGRIRIAVCIAILVPLLSVQPAPAGAAVIKIIRASRMAAWSTKSPDPRGITYNRSTGKLIISDSEVDEGSFWAGRNLFIAGRKGHLIRAGSTRKFTIEPEDLAWNDAAQTLFVVDDDQDRVFRVRPGKDGKIGTGDDAVTTALHTRRFGGFHPQGLAYVPKRHTLIVSDSDNSRVYKIRRGPDGRFDTRDDTVHSFGAGRFGFTNVEDVAVRFNRLFMVSSRQDFIVVTNIKGQLIRKIDISGTGIVAADGATFAPGTDGRPRRLYVTDAGVDENADPNENDGRLFELSIP
jgi:DNA-binding beta-propeller fold protein YncE